MVLNYLKSFIRNFRRQRQWKQKKIMVASNVSCSRCQMEEYVNIAHHAELKDCRIGKRTSIGRYTKIRNAEIGRYCSLSWNVTINAPNHPIDSISMSAFSFKPKFGLCQENLADQKEHWKKVTIGNDVWIGCNVVIKSGITIGDGAVIGAGAVVLKDVQPYEVVAGVPAKRIRFRFSENTIRRLENIKWWNLDDDEIKKNIHVFSPYNKVEEKPELLNILEQITNNENN